MINATTQMNIRSVSGLTAQLLLVKELVTSQKVEERESLHPSSGFCHPLHGWYPNPPAAREQSLPCVRSFHLNSRKFSHSAAIAHGSLSRAFTTICASSYFYSWWKRLKNLLFHQMMNSTCLQLLPPRLKPLSLFPSDLFHGSASWAVTKRRGLGLQSSS